MHLVLAYGRPIRLCQACSACHSSLCAHSSSSSHCVQSLPLSGPGARARHARRSIVARVLRVPSSRKGGRRVGDRSEGARAPQRSPHRAANRLPHRLERQRPGLLPAPERAQIAASQPRCLPESGARGPRAGGRSVFGLCVHGRSPRAAELRLWRPCQLRRRPCSEEGLGLQGWWTERQCGMSGYRQCSGARLARTSLSYAGGETAEANSV